MQEAATVLAQDLVKAYRRFVAVRGVTFSVAPRECFGFLGPNGAGKTSILRIISCVSPLTSGELWVNGLSVRTHGRQIRGAIGVVPQEETLDDELSVLDNLVVYARYFGLPGPEAHRRAAEALETFQLADRGRSKVDELSGGMKRRLLIARGLINHPRLLLLDEPTTGLDPQARHLVWRTLRGLREQGVTLLLTTHYMEEAAALCDRLIVLHEGRIVGEGAPQELVQRHAGETVAEVYSPDDGARARVAAVLKASGATVEETEDTVYGFGLDAAALQGMSWDGARPVVRPGNLEDVFLRLTGRALRE